MPEHEFKEEEFEGKISGRILKRILGLSRPYKNKLLGFLLFITIVAIFEAFNPLIQRAMIDRGIALHDTGAFFRYLGMTVLVHSVMAVSIFLFIWFAGWLSERLMYDLRRKCFSRLQELSFSYYDRTPIGWLMSRVTSDTNRIADLTTWHLVDLTWGVMHLLTAVIFMLLLNWKMALIVLAGLPLTLFVAIKFRMRIVTEFRKVRKINSKITAKYAESISGVRVVKALVRERRNLGLFSEESEHMYRASFRAAWLSAIFLPIVQLITALILGAVLWAGGRNIIFGRLTLGDLQAFIGYVTFIMWPIQDLSRVFAEMQRSLTSAERVFSLLDTEPEIQDKTGCHDAETLHGSIVFDHVDFYYDKKNPVLTDFSLTVHKNETIALVGPTGGGKTTIVNLVGRFYEPKKGVIRINGTDYTEYSLQSLQSRLGIILQTPHLFSGSIMDNIRYGRLDASDEEVIEAAKLAHAHEFIEALDGGYGEEVGEGGNLLSTGQKQLISIARAILSRPEIIIMDEATSSIDTLTEDLIQKGMDQLMKQATCFIIAHRLSTIRHADRILVIEGGKVSEAGSHRELLANRGHYYKLYTRQFRSEKAKAYHMFE
ncbi:MAG: ABC transporter ATP-binding protein [Spirochaetales bacterium]|nr:ABC transporter ATP-binding protein [Spirochaetales bacterium]